MQQGKFNCIIDGFWGSSGKGKVSTWLADHFNITRVSSSNYPNAGHSSVFEDGTKFVAKAIPTSAILKKIRGRDMECYISPGSGFSWNQLIKEWKECGKPEIRIHGRASLVTDDHAKREREGSESTAHIASTMQGSATAMVDKILRKSDAQLAGSRPLVEQITQLYLEDPATRDLLTEDPQVLRDFIKSVQVMNSEEFRDATQREIRSTTWLHEGSQGYSLSIDHGSHYPECTSRNCTIQAAMDNMAVAPKMVGDVYINLRTYPIRVGNLVDEHGVQKGYSGDFYPDCQELSWEEVASESGMPAEEAKALAERERTTVTKRIRRVCNFSFIGLKDAVRTNGATKLCVNFIQYINWQDNGIRGGHEALKKLSSKSREFLDKVEETAQIPIALIGTGALHNDIIYLL